MTDVASALVALDTIIEQGEGTGTSPIEIDGPGGSNDFAHYYRFMEIWEGRRLVADDSSPHGYSYRGEAVSFDPDRVIALRSIPARRTTPSGPSTRASTTTSTTPTRSCWRTCIT